MSRRSFPSAGVFGDVALLLDAEAKQYMQRSGNMPDNVKTAISQSKARGISVEELAQLCDVTTTHSELTGMVFPAYAVYTDGQIRAYIPEQYAKPTLSRCTRPAEQEATVEVTRYGFPKPSPPRRSGSMRNERHSHPDIRSLYTAEEEAAGRKGKLTFPDSRVRANCADPNPALERKASRQSLNTKDVRRCSQPSSVVSSQSAQAKHKERRTSQANSFTSISSDSIQCAAINKQ